MLRVVWRWWLFLGATACLCGVFMTACAHGVASERETSHALEQERVGRAVGGCDVAFFQPYMTADAQTVFLEVMRLGTSMLDGLETLKVKVQERYGVDPIVGRDGDVFFPGAVNMGGELVDARINLGFSPTMECTVLGIYGENVLLLPPSESCVPVTLDHSQIRIVRGGDGCLIDLLGTVDEAQPALRILRLFVGFLHQQNSIIESDQALSYVDWGGQFMGSFKATVREIQKGAAPATSHP